MESKVIRKWVKSVIACCSSSLTSIQLSKSCSVSGTDSNDAILRYVLNWIHFSTIVLQVVEQYLKNHWTKNWFACTQSNAYPMLIPNMNKTFYNRTFVWAFFFDKLIQPSDVKDFPRKVLCRIERNEVIG